MSGRIYLPSFWEINFSCTFFYLYSRWVKINSRRFCDIQKQKICNEKEMVSLTVVVVKKNRQIFCNVYLESSVFSPALNQPLIACIPIRTLKIMFNRLAVFFKSKRYTSSFDFCFFYIFLKIYCISSNCFYIISHFSYLMFLFPFNM